MKKSLVISASVVATLGVIALPLTSYADNTDTVTVAINSSCQTNTGNTTGAATNATFTKTMTNGTLWNTETPGGTNIGGSYNVSCNSVGGFTLKAIGDSAATTKTSMKSSTNNTAHDIVTGTNTSGASSWAFKIASAASGLTIAPGYNAYHTIPGTATTVLSSTGATNATTGAFSTGYQVYIGTAQQVGSYTGVVKYTLTAN